MANCTSLAACPATDDTNRDSVGIIHIKRTERRRNGGHMGITLPKVDLSIFAIDDGDHALWLHRPFRADEWLLYAQDSPNLHGSRGFGRGLIFKRDGTLVASVAQEGLVRQKR